MTYEPTEDGNSFFNEEDQEEKDTEQVTRNPNFDYYLN